MVHDINVQDTVVSKNEEEEDDVDFREDCCVQIETSQPSIFCDSNIISNGKSSLKHRYQLESEPSDE